MQEIQVQINFIAVVIFIGISLGLFISFFLMKKCWRNNIPNLIMGVIILALSLLMFEGLVNYTGYIFKVLWLTNFAEPLNFILPPLLYLFVASQFKNFKLRSNWFHFLPFVFWLGYCVFFFMQSIEMKYNSNVSVMQLDLPYMNAVEKFSEDPLHIRGFVNLATGISFIIYSAMTIRLLVGTAKSMGETLWKTTNRTLISSRNALYHTLIVVVIFIFVKILFSNSDLGDYFIYLYLSLMIFMTAAQIMNRSTYFNEVSTFFEGPVVKYKKSSLIEDNKEIILKAIELQMKDEKYFRSSSASLSGLSKAINESSHHVSQAINEKLNMSFFELLATYRVEEAKSILKTDLGKKLTIEDIAERVGYNSKSAFNTAFKKITSQTPSAFRDS